METESDCPTQTRSPPPVGLGKSRGISEEREEHLRRRRESERQRRVLETAEQKEASSAPFQAERDVRLKQQRRERRSLASA